jgi:hypothetical protein
MHLYFSHVVSSSAYMQTHVFTYVCIVEFGIIYGPELFKQVLRFSWEMYSLKFLLRYYLHYVHM